MSVERIRRKAGGYAYCVRWREHGRNRSRTLDRKPDAEAWDREVKRRRQLGPLAVEQLTDRTVTLGEWIADRWVPEHGVTLERSTRTRYADVHALHISPALDDVPLNGLTVGVLRRWQARLIAEGMKPGTVHKCRTFLSSVLRHAAEAEAIPANPLALVRAPRAEHREQVRPLAPATVERIRAALDAERAAIVAVLAYAGLRPGELRALRWGDVRDRTILVQRGADPDGKAKTTKTRAVRTVRLLAPLAADLREWRMASGRPGYLFNHGPERKRFSDPDASWGHRSAISTRKGGGFHGYKLQAAVCTKTGLPVAWEVAAARTNESTFVADLLDTAKARGFTVETCAMDKAYDIRRVHDECAQRGCQAIVPLKQTTGVKRGDHLPPSCEHGPWRFAGSDYKRQAAKWRCPTGECSPASTWVKADRLHPLIPRETLRWKGLYRRRSAIEREFGRLKHDWALLPLRVRGIDRVKLHADLTILAKLATTLERARAVSTLAHARR